MHNYRVWYIPGGAECPSLSRGAASLVPGATEHQQKASRPWAFGKASMFVFVWFCFLNLTNATFDYLLLSKMMFQLEISSLTLVFNVCLPGVVLVVGSLAGVDLLSLDGHLAVRCSNATLPYQEVKRFIRVARWVYQATGCKYV